MHRWASRGLKGVKLRTAYAGGHKRTTEEWLREFFDSVTAAAQGATERAPQICLRCPARMKSWRLPAFSHNECGPDDRRLVRVIQTGEP
ncbi:MAG: hypothetical protein KDB00_30350 [Planctomycetales bacterium]|nr:hypothetical protein [Planctomycetales bacterium]